jgi:hypothetical protein
MGMALVKVMQSFGDGKRENYLKSFYFSVVEKS